MRIAQTNLQLYNQLRGRRFSTRDLTKVHGAYEFLTSLYPCHYQPDGKPFVAHCLGVAGILAELGESAEMVTVGLLHNVYGNADFGDGPDPGATPSRRELVREVVGPRVEDMLVRFPRLRIRPGTVQEVRRRLPDLDETERELLVVDLADYLEKYADLGLLYFGDAQEIFETTDLIGDDLIDIARRLGRPRLGEMLSEHFAELAAEADAVPGELRPSDGRRHVKVIPPRSCECAAGQAVRA